MNLICGINPVVEALRVGSRHFDRLVIVKGLRNRRISEAISRASQTGVPLRFEPREALDRMAGGTPHQGIIAVVSEKPVLSLPEVLERTHDPALLIVLDGVEDPRNLGAILRTAEAAGADGIILPERHSASLSETVARSSAGALEHVRIARVGNLVNALESLKSRGIWVVGFDAHGKERWDAVDLRRPIALVLGGEGKGIRRLVREHCDHLVSLPLFGHVESLNVSVAAGIALYEVVRQRGLSPSHVRPIPVTPKPVVKHVIGPSPDDLEHDPGALPGMPFGVDHAHVEIEEDTAWETTAIHGLDEGSETGLFRTGARSFDGAVARRGSPGAPGGSPQGRRRRGHGRRHRGPASAMLRGQRTHPSGEGAGDSEAQSRLKEGSVGPPGGEPGRRKRRRRRRRRPQ